MCVLTAQSCPTLCDPLDCSPPGSSAHGILQARRLEWGAIPFSRGACRPRDGSRFSCIAGRLFPLWAPREVSREALHTVRPCTQYDLVHSMNVCAESLQSRLSLCDPMGCSPPGSSVRRILQARVQERVVMPTSRGSFWPGGQTCVSCVVCLVSSFLTTEPARERVSKCAVCSRVGPCCWSTLCIIVCICSSRTPGLPLLCPLAPWQPHLSSMSVSLFLFHKSSFVSYFRFLWFSISFEKGEEMASSWLAAGWHFQTAHSCLWFVIWKTTVVSFPSWEFCLLNPTMPTSPELFSSCVKPHFWKQNYLHPYQEGDRDAPTYLRGWMGIFLCHWDSAPGSHYFFSLKMMGTWVSLLGAEMLFFLSLLLASLSKRGRFLGGSVVKNTPANAGDTGDAGGEDSLEKEMATHSSILAWEVPWTGGPVGYSPLGHKESDKTECAHTHTHTSKRDTGNLGTVWGKVEGSGNTTPQPKGWGSIVLLPPETEWQLSGAPLSIWAGDLGYAGHSNWWWTCRRFGVCFLLGYVHFQMTDYRSSEGCREDPLCRWGICLWPLKAFQTWPTAVPPRPLVPPAASWAGPHQGTEASAQRAGPACGPHCSCIPSVPRSAVTVTRAAPFPGTHNGLRGHPGVSEGEDILFWDLNSQVLPLRGVK